MKISRTFATEMTLVYLLFLFGICFGLLPGSDCRTFASRCDFIFELEEFHNVTLEEAAKWACLVTPGASTKDVTKPGANVKKPEGQYIGIFKIGNKWWCNSEDGGACKIRCDKLLDEYIGDDLRCARRIGFQGWTDHKHCFEEGWRDNIKSCEGYVSPLMVAKAQR